MRWQHISISQCLWYHQESSCFSWQPHGSKQQRVVSGCAGEATSGTVAVYSKKIAEPCLVWVTSNQQEQQLCNFSSNLSESQHQLRWFQVVRLHYHINNLSDYKWSVVAASDIAATAHCKEEEKKVGFSITEKFQLPRHLRALRKYKWCCDGTAVNRFTQSNGQHKWQEKPALSLTWRPNSDWIFLFNIQLSELYVSWKHSAFRAAHTLSAVQVRLRLL